MISVVIPVYNKELSISKTIHSVLNQTFTDYEIVVVNDGSTDNTLKSITAIQDSRIRIINKENGGVSSARNLGIEMAQFEWIALLDGDDLWKDNHLSNIAKLINSLKAVKVICTGFCLAKTNGEILEKFKLKESSYGSYFDLTIKYGFITNSSAIAFKKELFDAKTRFRTDLTMGEDIEVWEKLARKTNFYFTNKITSFYIDDSENKAIFKPHKLESTYIYTLNLNTVNDKLELTYYKSIIIYDILKVIKGKGSYKYSLALLKKHFADLKIIDFISFIKAVLYKKK